MKPSTKRRMWIFLGSVAAGVATAIPVVGPITGALVAKILLGSVAGAIGGAVLIRRPGDVPPTRLEDDTTDPGGRRRR